MKKEDYYILGIITRIYDVIYEHKENVLRYPEIPIEAVSVPYLVEILEKIKGEIIDED